MLLPWLSSGMALVVNYDFPVHNEDETPDFDTYQVLRCDAS
jgi:hypothetical protein